VLDKIHTANSSQIFPGANVPSITQLLTSMHKGSGRKLILEKLENIGYHYEQALKIWRTNFVSNFSSRIRPELLKANPTMSDVELESFKRKWEVSSSAVAKWAEANVGRSIIFVIVKRVFVQKPWVSLCSLLDGRGMLI